MMATHGAGKWWSLRQLACKSFNKVFVCGVSAKDLGVVEGGRATLHRTGQLNLLLFDLLLVNWRSPWTHVVLYPRALRGLTLLRRAAVVSGRRLLMSVVVALVGTIRDIHGRCCRLTKVVHQGAAHVDLRIRRRWRPVQTWWRGWRRCWVSRHVTVSNHVLAQQAMLHSVVPHCHLVGFGLIVALRALERRLVGVWDVLSQPGPIVTVTKVVVQGVLVEELKAHYQTVFII